MGLLQALGGIALFDIDDILLQGADMGFGYRSDDRAIELDATAVLLRISGILIYNSIG